MPWRRAASIAALATSAEASERAAKIPPVWSQRTPSSPKRRSQSTASGRICETAVCPRSEQPTAPRMPKPRSVKFRPLRTDRPTPSEGTHWTN